MYRSNKKENFNSRFNHVQENPFDKDNWGPKMWDVMHTFSFAYPINPTSKQKEAALHFYSSIGHMIPCNNCSKHCIEYVQKNPITLNTKEDLILWVYTFHNEVNKRIGKMIYPLDRLYKRFEGIAFCEE